MPHYADKKSTVQGCIQGQVQDRLNTMLQIPSHLSLPVSSRDTLESIYYPEAMIFKCVRWEEWGELHWWLRAYDHPPSLHFSSPGLSTPWQLDSALAQQCRSELSISWPHLRSWVKESLSLDGQSVLKEVQSNWKNKFRTSGPAVALITRLGKGSQKLAFEMGSTASCSNNTKQSKPPPLKTNFMYK